VLVRRGYLLLLAALVTVGLAVAALVYAARPPRPALPYPPGQSLASVRGNCERGNEVLGCGGSGPRSFLTVTADGDIRAAAGALLAGLLDRGWAQDDKGKTAVDHAAGAAREDIQPVYCKGGQGCVGLFRLGQGSYVLAWFDNG
jgi:hypothetical protein